MTLIFGDRVLCTNPSLMGHLVIWILISRSAEKNFGKFFLLVDGIYPELARFVKSFQEPIGKSKIYYSKWQEGAQKDIVRAFGVLLRKFQILTRPFEQWSAGDIHYIIMTCVILHNAMVSVRINQNEEESNGCYNYLKIDDGDKLVDCSVPPDQEEAEVVQVAQCRSDFQSTCLLQRDQPFDMQAINPAYKRSMLSFRMDVAQERWQSLCDKDAHNLLREAIISELGSHQTDEDELKKWHKPKKLVLRLSDNVIITTISYYSRSITFSLIFKLICN